jgi:outer membrane protein TolC
MHRVSVTIFAIAAAILNVHTGCRTTPKLPKLTSAQTTHLERIPHAPSAVPVESLPDWPIQPVALVQEAQEEIPSPPESARDEAVLTLTDAIRLAFDANPDLTSSAEQFAEADAALARARAEFYPRLGISEQYGVTNNPVTAFMFQLNQGNLSLMQDFNNPQTTDNFQTQMRLQQSVYAGERRLHATHAAEAQAAAATMSLAALQNQMVFRVAEAYYRLLQSRDLVAVRREAVDQVRQHLEIVRVRFRNGTAVKSDVLTVEVRLAEEQESLITAQNQFELAWAVLENVTGAPLVMRALPHAIPVAPWSEHVDEVEAAVAAATSQRAEVGALASQRQAAVENVLVAEAGKRLGVDVVGDYDAFTGDFIRGNDSFFVGVVFQLNLFDGGRTRSDVARATARVRELEARERRLMLDIELDVRRAYLQLKDSDARLKVATQAIGQASESLREIEVRYRGQTATITQLIDAQVALSNARVRRATAQAEVEIARAALERAAGRLDALISP